VENGFRELRIEPSGGFNEDDNGNLVFRKAVHF
jgi:hypothetical protein